MLAQAASCVFLYGLPYLLPELRYHFGLSLAASSWLVTSPLIGVVLTLIAWGAAADRYGERLIITAGLVIAAVALVGAATAHDAVTTAIMLAVAGAGGASVNAASGRLVLGWFAASERGLAMGARQTAQPLGTMLAAAMLPPIAAAAGTGAALAACAGLCLLTGLAVALFTADPPRPARASGQVQASPYRGFRRAEPGPSAALTLVRVHAASAMLVIPQFVVTGFALEYLVNVRGWAVVAAGRAIAGANLAGALTRIAAGIWSDRVRSRLRPMRQLAWAIAAVMALVALGTRSPLGPVALLTAAALSVSTNGLAFTAVAEIAGMSWAGRALGVQNTVQNITGAATPPATAQVIDVLGYPAAFGIAAVFPFLAGFCVPARRPPAQAPPGDLHSSSKESIFDVRSRSDTGADHRLALPRFPHCGRLHRSRLGREVWRMNRAYGEPVDVQYREDGRPVRFVWRGRLYTVRAIVEHWVINREWWQQPEGEPRQPELVFWRVEASPGQGLAVGVYELRRDVAADTWTLRRVAD
jgi:MFS family permease